MARQPRIVRYSVPIAAMALTYLVVAVFVPIVNFQFIDLDVRRQVVDNPHIRELSGENLKHIFTSRCVTSYYPVRTLTYAVDHQFWGLSPRGFKLTNGLIHLANVLLVFWLILRLNHHGDTGRTSTDSWWDASVATVFAGVFAVHPVVVQPVIWVAGREELLMTLGVLGCFHCHLTARRLGESLGMTGSTLAWHLAAACCCLVASLSSAVAAVIPLLITAWDLLTISRPKFRKILLGTALLWLIGAATIVIKKLGPLGAPPDPGLPGPFSAERLMLVLNTYRLNLTALIYPKDLALSYDWCLAESFLDSGVLVGGIALVLTGAVLLLVRERKLLLFGLIWFGSALGPTSQIMPHHVSRADRFLYLPLVGLVLALALAVTPLAKTIGHRLVLIAVGVALLLGLNVLDAGHVRTWQDSIHVWENCVKVDPHNHFARCCLANNLANAGQFERAFQEYRATLETEPENVEALSNFAWQLATCDEQSLRDYDLALELAESACTYGNWEDPEAVRKFAVVHCAAAADLRLRGEHQPAIEHYKIALHAAPDYDLPLFNLILQLTVCPDVELRDPETAALLAERALRLTDDLDVQRLTVLAAAFSEAGRFEQAVAVIGKAIRTAQDAAHPRMAADLNRQLKHYRNRLPFHSLED